MAPTHLWSLDQDVSLSPSDSELARVRAGLGRIPRVGKRWAAQGLKQGWGSEKMEEGEGGGREGGMKEIREEGGTATTVPKVSLDLTI